MAKNSAALFLVPFEGKDKGFFLRNRKRGEVFEIETASGHTYGVFIANPASGLVVLHSRDSKHILSYPIWAYLRGSTAGGTALWSGRVGPGLETEFFLLADKVRLTLSETIEIYWLAPSEE